MYNKDNINDGHEYEHENYNDGIFDPSTFTTKIGLCAIWNLSPRLMPRSV